MIDGNRVQKGDVEALPVSWIERIDVVNDEVSNAALRTPIASEKPV